MQDRKALAKPWTGTLYYELRNDWDLGEISCSGDYLDFNNFESFSFTGLSRGDVVAIAAIGVTGFTASTDP
jgi:hypothetical protein